MKGLLIKDLLGIRSQSKLYIVILGAYSVFTYMNKDTSLFTSMVTLMGVMYVVTAMAYDEKCNWNKSAICMPVSRDDIVISKYLLGVIFIAVTFFLNAIMTYAISTGDIAKAIYNSLPLVGIALAYISVILPIMFKFGVEKGRILIIGVVFVPAIIFFMIAESDIDLTWLTEDFINSLIPFSPLVILIIMLISTFISCKIFSKKEF